MNRARALRARSADPATIGRLADAGAHPVLARLLAARGVADPRELADDLARMLPPAGMLGLDRAAELLSDAIDADQRICVVADYDCDGATACALAVRGLRMLGARVDYLVPNRFVHGYGLSPAVVEMALAHPRLGRPHWLLTVDNGIASLEGVDAARRAGLRTIVTDHHLAGPALPAADAIVNPNQPGCGFASRNLAGVGVMFYLLAALRSRRRACGTAPDRLPRLAELLDLVAVGTVADLVALDANNRLLVAAGLRRIRAGRASPGLRALLRVAGVDPAAASARDLGFGVGPRINAAGRLSDIATGIECLLADDDDRAQALAGELDSINRERRRIERDMREQAIAGLPEHTTGRDVIVVSHPQWHEGIVGLVASRLKDRHYRPVIAFAPAAGEPGVLKGSGRSIAGLHLRDALETVANRHPGLILRYGGHAMAAGLSLHAARLAEFEQALDDAVGRLAAPGAFDEVLLHDGPLSADEIDLALARALDDTVWGQAFPAPLFRNRFSVERQRPVADAHMKLTLRLQSRIFDAIAFGRTEPFGAEVDLIYRVARNDWQGRSSVQLIVEDEAPPDPHA